MHPRVRRKLGCVRLTPGADHVLGERQSAHVHLAQRPELLPATELGTERGGVPLPVERLGSMTAPLPPANPPPHRSVLQDVARSPCRYSLAPLRCLQGCHRLPMLTRARVHLPGEPRRTLHSKPPPRPAPFPRDIRGGRVVGVASKQKAQVRRGSPGLKCVIGLHTSLHTFLYTWAARPHSDRGSVPPPSRSSRQQLGGNGLGRPSALDLEQTRRLGPAPTPVNLTHERERAAPRRPRRPASRGGCAPVRDRG